MRDAGPILQTIFDAFTTKISLVPSFTLPKQQFVHTGALAQDCELFAVHAVNIYQGSPGLPRPGYQDATGGISFYSMDVGVSIVRSSPLIGNSGRIPPANDLNKASAQATRDASVLLDAYNAAMADHSLSSICDNIYLGGITWIGPQGGMLETMLTMSVQL